MVAAKGSAAAAAGLPVDGVGSGVWRGVRPREGDGAALNGEGSDEDGCCCDGEGSDDDDDDADCRCASTFSCCCPAAAAAAAAAHATIAAAPSAADPSRWGACWLPC